MAASPHQVADGCDGNVGGRGRVHAETRWSSHLEAGTHQRGVDVEITLVWRVISDRRQSQTALTGCWEGGVIRLKLSTTARGDVSNKYTTKQ